MSIWNGKRFSVYESDEKNVLGLLKDLGVITNDVADEINKKTDYNGNHNGSWQGLKRPTLSDEGMRATVEKHIKDIKKLENDILKGGFNSKKYCAMGDSITYGFVDNPYAKIVSNEMGMTLNNMGISGSHIVYENNESIKSIFANRALLPSDCDVISIMGGTNDFGHDKPIGDSSSNSFYNFYGALKIMIEWIQEKRPGAKLFFITPMAREHMDIENKLGYNLEDYVNVIKDVCSMYSVPVLDLFNDCSINPNISAHKAKYTSDGLHPNQIGHEVIAKKIIDFMRGL